MAQILEESLNEIYIFDAETLRFIQVNRGARINLGYSMEELSLFMPLDLIPEFTSELFTKLIKPLKTGDKERILFTTVHRRKDGTLYDVEVHLQLSTFQSKPAFVAIILDITRRREMERELIKVQKHESVGILAGGIAHDFNNGLQAILGYITLAEMRTNSKDKIYEFLEEARKAVLQSKGLSRQLLTFSKNGATVMKTVSVSELIMNSTKLALSGSNIKCNIGLPGSIWRVEVDKGQIHQVISNLIINADQAMPDGGNINVWAENTVINERDSFSLLEGKYVKITIKDYGTGISKEHLQKIFDPYFTTKKNGSGLGLATAYSIIKQHNGNIIVESDTGVGTIFHIYLPVSREESCVKSIQNKA